MKLAIACICLLALGLIVFKNRSGSKGSSGSAKKLKGPAKKTTAKVTPSAKRPSGAKQQGKSTVKKSPGTEHHPYRATVIVCSSDACEAAREIAGKPYLVSERNTPELPLPGCDAATCNCKYRHRNDRREDDSERRFRSSLGDSVYLAKGDGERRGRKRGRRATD